MINTLKKMLGIGPSANYKELVAKGAKIIDVRTRSEFASDHAKGSINIPLNELAAGAQQLKKEDTIITCCASGIRSAAAKSSLKSMGFAQVHNGGAWSSLNAKI
jgi:phage shock protein E